jgi:hypothetical protein
VVATCLLVSNGEDETAGRHVKMVGPARVAQRVGRRREAHQLAWVRSRAPSMLPSPTLVLIVLVTSPKDYCKIMMIPS